MAIITIEVLDECMTIRYAQLPKSRVVWRAPGLEVRVKGSLAGCKWEQAANLAMHECLNRHIPVISLRTVKK